MNGTPLPDGFGAVTFHNGEVELKAITAGPSDGPLVILLHGFPEFWYSWRHQISFLAEQGFRVVAPDQRGYNQSSKPRPVAQYALQHLVSDVLCVLQQSGRERAFLAGHDWGALVAWAFAFRHPDKVERLVIINVPHPEALRNFLFGHPAQLLRSWYVFFFQIPFLPEALFKANRFAAGTRSLQTTSLPGTFSEDDLRHYRAAWSQRGAPRAMIHWYRAMLRYSWMFRIGKINVSTLIIWGEKDRFLLPDLAAASLRFCREGNLRLFERCTHWVHQEDPQEVNRLILTFFSDGKTPTSAG